MNNLDEDREYFNQKIRNRTFGDDDIVVTPPAQHTTQSITNVPKKKEESFNTITTFSDEQIREINQKYKSIVAEKAVLVTENDKFRKERQMFVDPNNLIAQSMLNAKQFIMYAIFYGFYEDEDEYLETNYLHPNQGTDFSRHKLLITHLKKSTKRDDGILLDILRFVVMRDVYLKLETFVDLLSICMNFQVSPMRKEVYLVSNGSMSFVHINYMAFVGYCERIGLVTQKITLPEINFDDKSNRGDDRVEIKLHPKIHAIHPTGEYTYSITRKDMSPFIATKSDKDSDFHFKKIAVVWALRDCFSYKHEIKGVYIKEEAWVEGNKDDEKLSKGKEDFSKAMETLDQD